MGVQGPLTGGPHQQHAGGGARAQREELLGVAQEGHNLHDLRLDLGPEGWGAATWKSSDWLVAESKKATTSMISALTCGGGGRQPGERGSW